jgi:hypothetical protein
MTRLAIGGAVLATMLAGGAYATPTESLLHGFTGTDGNQPIALVADGKGNFYGTTYAGGKTVAACPSYSAVDATGATHAYPGGCGIVFKLSPPAAGKKTWTRTTVHNFTNRDGSNPGGNLILGKAGNLYGVTGTGGAGTPACPSKREKGIFAGCGVVFRLTPPAAGKTVWSETVLHSFVGTDGAAPSGIASNAAGVIFGTTARGGNSATACPADGTSGNPAGCGVAFRLIPPAAGKTVWTQTHLHDFGIRQDGARPSGPPLLVRSKLFGVATEGGAKPASCAANAALNLVAGCGIVYELTPSGKDWTETVIWRFAGGTGGALPYGGVIPDAAGNLYGTTSAGGTGGNTSVGTTGNGLVFRLSPPATGQANWTKTNLHAFAGGADGAVPVGTLLKDPAGAIYGTTGYGGTTNLGTVFELAKPASGNGPWKETVLHRFLSNPYTLDGLIPLAGVVRDAHGALYGTTVSSGTFASGNFKSGNGAVFKITP